MNPQEFGSFSSSMEKSDTSSPRTFAAKVKEGVASLSKHVPGSPSYKKEHSSPKMGNSSPLPVNMGPNASPTPYRRDHGTPSPKMSSRSLTPARNVHESPSRLNHQTPSPVTKAIRSPASFLEEVINKTLIVPDRRHPRGVSDARPGSTEDRDYGFLDSPDAPTSSGATDTASGPVLVTAPPPTPVPVASDIEPVEISMSHLAITEARLAATKARLRALPANDMYILGLSGATSLDDEELRLLAKARNVVVKDTDDRKTVLKSMYNTALTTEQAEKRMERFHEQLVGRSSEAEEKGSSVQVTPKKFAV